VTVLRPLVLVLAALVAAPSLWDALVRGTAPVDAALVRFLVAVPVCALACAGWRALVGAFAAPEGEVVDPPRRRREDRTEPVGSP
jgi:hypothetical protein